jgi:ribonuclease HII
MISIIKECSHSYAIGLASPREIEQINILQASFLAMRRAVEKVSHPFDLLLVDGNAPVSEYSGVQKTVVKGDNHCFAIAAASILAKEARDQYMTKAAEKYPEYGFDSHVGYGTAKHIDMIHELGICELHRRTFAPINKIIAQEVAGAQSPLN